MKNCRLVYVLILNWNGKQLTIDCIQSILKSNYPNFRIVVIDNGSIDSSVAILREEFGDRITILENGANLGYSRGFNVGLRYGFKEKNADYCLVMNNDTIIDSQTISEMVKVAETDDRIGFVTGKVYYYGNPNVLQTVGKKEDPIRWNGDHMGNKEIDKGQYDRISERCFVDDIYTLISKKLYQDTGGYSPLFFLQGEEYDWQARAKRLGYKIMYTPFAKLWHKESMTLGRDSAKKAYFDARNPMLVILLHQSPDFFKKYFWYHLYYDIFRSSLISLKQGKMINALAKWQGFFSGLKWALKNRRLSFEHFI